MAAALLMMKMMMVMAYKNVCDESVPPAASSPLPQELGSVGGATVSAGLAGRRRCGGGVKAGGRG